MKRAFDLVASAALLVVAAPLMAVIAIAVRATMGAPVLFRQQRPGLGGKPFVIYKFRTMAPAADQRTAVETDAERVSALGRFLRESSLDELPELWNVLRGDMSLVGPRPLLMEYLELYTPEQARRHEVRPGITGWAQVNGRNALEWEDKFRFDVWYVDNRSAWLDLRILWMTAAAVLRRDGIAKSGFATTDRFRGAGR